MSTSAGPTSSASVYTTPAFWERLWRTAGIQSLLCFIGSLTGYENLLIFAKLYDLPHREPQAWICEALDFMGLTADGGRLVGKYSGGMVRPLEIAQSRQSTDS